MLCTFIVPLSTINCLFFFSIQFQLKISIIGNQTLSVTIMYSLQLWEEGIISISHLIPCNYLVIILLATFYSHLYVVDFFLFGLVSVFQAEPPVSQAGLELTM